jgi:predicted metal-dependent HD superfamily phosphohydrolase
MIMTSERKDGIPFINSTTNMDSTHSSINDVDLVQLLIDSPVRSNSCFDCNDDDDNLKDTIRSYVQQEWHHAVAMLEGTSTEIKKQWFDIVWEHHTEPGRYYHTVMHVYEMLQYLSMMAEHSTWSEHVTTVLRLSTFFHDIVYNAQSTTNERDSADMFQSFAEEVDLPMDITESVVAYILATQHHQVSTDALGVMDIFLDIDMAVLGKQEKAYESYAQLIRHEYSFVPELTYREKRAAFLESVLQHERIFKTDIAWKVWEGAARANIQKEIKTLRKPA